MEMGHQILCLTGPMGRRRQRGYKRMRILWRMLTNSLVLAYKSVLMVTKNHSYCPGVAYVIFPGEIIRGTQGYRKSVLAIGH